jgi:hypothetical protein
LAESIKPADPEKGQAVDSVVETEDDKSPTDVNRPPFSTNKPDVPIAHSSGPMEPQGQPDYIPEEGTPEPAARRPTKAE